MSTAVGEGRGPRRAAEPAAVPPSRQVKTCSGKSSTKRNSRDKLNSAWVDCRGCRQFSKWEPVIMLPSAAMSSPEVHLPQGRLPKCAEFSPLQPALAELCLVRTGRQPACNLCRVPTAASRPWMHSSVMTRIPAASEETKLHEPSLHFNLLPA